MVHKTTQIVHSEKLQENFQFSSSINYYTKDTTVFEDDNDALKVSQSIVQKKSSVELSHNAAATRLK